LGFSPDSRWLVSGASNDDTGTVNFWDVSMDSPASEPHHQCRLGAPVSGLSFDADGRYAVTGEHGGLKAHLWDLRAANPCNSQRTWENGESVVQIALSRDARWAATANFDHEGTATGKLWDLGAGTAPTLKAEAPFNDRVVQGSISGDQRWVAFGAWDNSVKALDLRKPISSKPAEFLGHTGRLLSVAFTPDSRYLVTTGEDRTARVWDPDDPQQAPVVLRGHEGPVWLVGFSQDSHLLVTRSADETIMLWHLDLTDLVDIACRAAARQLTDKEVAEIIGDGSARRPCVGQLQPSAMPHARTPRRRQKVSRRARRSTDANPLQLQSPRGRGSALLRPYGFSRLTLTAGSNSVLPPWRLQSSVSFREAISSTVQRIIVAIGLSRRATT
jgi:WD40 repeat protein